MPKASALSSKRIIFFLLQIFLILGKSPQKPRAFVTNKTLHSFKLRRSFDCMFKVFLLMSNGTGFRPS